VEDLNIRSLPVSPKVRRLVGFGVKFVDFGDAMEEVSLYAEDTLFLNMRSDVVRALIRYLEADCGPASEHLARIFVLLHSEEFQAVEDYSAEVAELSVDDGSEQKKLSFRSDE
jgi:hypothetical protein